jgi:hypothetical protein
VIDAVAFVLANQNARRTSISVDDAGQKEALNLGFVNDAWWPMVTGLRARTAVSEIDRRMLELCVVIQVANDLKSGDLCIPGSDKFRDYRLQLLSWEEVERESVVPVDFKTENLLLGICQVLAGLPKVIVDLGLRIQKEPQKRSQLLFGQGLQYFEASMMLVNFSRIGQSVGVRRVNVPYDLGR